MSDNETFEELSPSEIETLFNELATNMEKLTRLLHVYRYGIGEEEISIGVGGESRFNDESKLVLTEDDDQDTVKLIVVSGIKTVVKKNIDVLNALGLYGIDVAIDIFDETEYDIFMPKKKDKED